MMANVILTENEFNKLIKQLREYKKANKYLNEQIEEYNKKFTQRLIPKNDKVVKK